MQNTTYLLLAITYLLCCIACQETPTSWQLTSPNEAITIQIEHAGTPDSTYLSYSVSFHEGEMTEQVLLPSSLGLQLADTDLSKNLTFLQASSMENEAVEYTMITGSKDSYTNQYNEIQLHFENAEQKKISLNFRAYNNGIAFQYVLPEAADEKVTIINELTSFRVNDGQFWAQPYDAVTKWSPGYERFYEQFPTGTNAPEEKNGWAFPLLFETDDVWLFISESGFDGTYGGSHIEENVTDNTYRMKFAEVDEANNNYAVEPTVELPYKTPWRFITLGDNLGDIVESHLVTDLADENELEDTDWVKPGRASWSWWSVNDSPQDYELLVPFVDLAAEMGWEYSLVDANWNNMKNGTLEDLAAYAETKGVELLVWYNSGGKHNSVTEAPRDLMFERKARRKEFERIHDMGIRGIKVDFFQSDKPTIINQYIDILEDAADYELLVNFHGCTLPKGWRRTYPHLMTMEAILGGEAYLFSDDYPTKAPAHLTTLPFIRNVAGPTDYTPGGFAKINKPHLTTYGFEAALPVLIESGIIHYVTAPEVVASLPAFAVGLLKNIPATWDDVQYLSGYPGKEVVLARKSGNQWYIAGINGENTTKTLQIDLSTIVEGEVDLTLVIDGETSTELELEKRVVKDAMLTIELQPFGGFVGIMEE